MLQAKVRQHTLKAGLTDAQLVLRVVKVCIVIANGCHMDLTTLAHTDACERLQGQVLSTGMAADVCVGSTGMACVRH